MAENRTLKALLFDEDNETAVGRTGGGQSWGMKSAILQAILKPL